MENICNLLTAPCTKYKAFKTSNKFFSGLGYFIIEAGLWLWGVMPCTECIP